MFEEGLSILPLWPDMITTDPKSNQAGYGAVVASAPSVLVPILEGGIWSGETIAAGGSSLDVTLVDRHQQAHI